LNLFPPFDPNVSGVQSFKDHKISFVPYDFKSPEKLQPVKLAISAANEHRTDKLNSMVLINLQPLNWTFHSHNSIGFDYVNPDGELFIESQTLTQLDNLGYLFELTTISNTNSFVDEQTSHNQILLEKKEGLKSLLAQIENFDILPVYGHKVQSQWQLFKILYSLTKAKNMSSNLFSKGIIVPVFNSVSETHFAKSIDLANANVKSEVPIQYAEITDSNLQGKIKTLKAGQILAINVGPTTKEIFEYVFTRATLPAVVEGVNSINLMQMTGKPYLPSDLRLTDQYPFLDDIKKNKISLSAEETQFFSDATKAITDIADPGNLYQEEPLAKYFLHSKQGSEIMSNFYLRFSTNPEKNLLKDKLVRALLIARRKMKIWENKYNINLSIKSCRDVF
jgi:hypothetical protein